MGGDYRLGRRPALDGLRGLAVFLVVASHCWWENPTGAGTVGVTLFFVLSGFLISRLLIEEHADSGRLDLPRFMARRARRLLPALALFLITLAAAGIPLSAIAVTATYLADIPAVADFAGHPAGLPDLAHTWSLSLEEQFYLVWPLTLDLLMRRGRSWTLIFLAAGISAVSVWRVVLIAHGASVTRVSFTPDTRVDALLAGCLLALCADQVPHKWMGRVALLGASVLAAGCVMTGVESSAWKLPLVTVAATAVIAWAGTATATRGLTWEPLRGLGRISYGVYLWHYPFALSLAPRMAPWAAFLLVFPLSIVIAWLSWQVIERRFLQRPILDRQEFGDRLVTYDRRRDRARSI